MMHDHRLAARRIAVYHDRRRSMMTGLDDDRVMLRGMIVRAWLPSRRGCRTRLPADPLPDVVIIQPAFIIRDVFFLVEDIAVLRDRHDFRTGHDDRFFDDRRGRFHDDRFLDDRRGRFHDDRSGARFDDRPHQVHDVSRKLDAVARARIVVIPCEGSCRSEDDRCSEGSADNECLVDGLLDRVSYGKRFGFCFASQFNLGFLIILYSELFVLSNGF